MKKLLLLLVAVLSIGLCASSQTRTVSGTVVDATNDEPLFGAAVAPVGTSNGVITDINGKFTLPVASSVKEIQVSYIGYKTLIVAVSDKPMNIALEPEAETLDAIVVTGYGSGRKLGTVVGSVAVVGSESLANVTTPSFVDALQGKVSGLSILSSSGDPSSVENSIRLRGVNSLNSSNTPLFILDGAPVTQTVFSTLNPNDIESITVLKDAASVAIYGSRAANGVIVITSKRGKYAEKTSLNIRAKMGWSQMTTDRIDMMNSAEYVQFRDLIGQPVSDDMRYAALDLGIDTDWRAEIFSGHAPTYSIEAGLNGGTESTNYYLSMNHLEQDGIIDQSSMRRETVRLSLQSRITDWLRIGVQTNLGYTKYQTNNESNAIYSGDGVYTTNPMVSARKALPMDSPYYYTLDENGKPIWGEKAKYLHYSKMPTPACIEDNRSVWRNRVTFNGNLFEELTPVKGLTIRTQQAVDAYDTRLDNRGFAHYQFTTPMGDTYPDQEDPLVTGYNQQSFTRYYQFTLTNTAEYRFKVNHVHNITVLAGEESIVGKSESFGLFVEGSTDDRMWLLQQNPSVKPSNLSQGFSQMAMNSLFLATSYNYADKYFVDLNYRRDGSSYFAPDHRWANFWSAGIMWNLKQENFLKFTKWVDDLKFRVSYGTTGNSSFANYAYFGLLGSGSNYNGQPSIGIAQPSNYNLTWERVGGLDVGVKFGLFNKVRGDVAFYTKKTTDMLIEIPYSYTTGIGSGWGNVAAMRNTGVDIDLSYTPISTRDWMWEIRANMNYNKNEITALFDGLDEIIFPNANIIDRVGNVANSYYMVEYAGVDPRDGMQLWYTREGNLTKTYNFERDAKCISDRSPISPLAGGFGTTVSWKGLALRCDFVWALNKYMINNDLYFCQNTNFAQTFNQTKKMLDVWTTPGQKTDIPAVGETIQFDTRLLENASFMRLKNLTLQYQLPSKLTKRISIAGASVHFTGRNLLTFTGYTGYDPEPETNVVAFFYPNTRQYEFGLDVSF